MALVFVCFTWTKTFFTEKKLTNLNNKMSRFTTKVVKYLELDAAKLCMCLHCFENGAAPDSCIQLNNSGTKMHRKNTACARPFPVLGTTVYKDEKGKSQVHKVYDESDFTEKKNWVAIRIPGAYYTVAAQATFCHQRQCYVWHCSSPEDDLRPVPKFAPEDDNFYAWLQKHVAEYTNQAAVDDERALERDLIEQYLHAIMEQDSDSDDSIVNKSTRAIEKRRAESRDAHAKRALADAAEQKVEAALKVRATVAEEGDEARLNDATHAVHSAHRDARDARELASEAELRLDCERAGSHGGSTRTTARKTAVSRTYKVTPTMAQRAAAGNSSSSAHANNRAMPASEVDEGESDEERSDDEDTAPVQKKSKK